MDSGRPALVVPFSGAAPELAVIPSSPGNGSREAARAVHDALPFLLAAEGTTVLLRRSAGPRPCGLSRRPTWAPTSRRTSRATVCGSRSRPYLVAGWPRGDPRAGGR